MVQANLKLVLAPAVRYLVHQSKLNRQVLSYGIAQGAISSVPVEQFHGPSLAYVAFSIDEQLIVKGEVKAFAVDGLGVQRHCNEQVIAVTCSKVLVLHPTLLITKAVFQVKDAPHLMREQDLLVDSALRHRSVVGGTIVACGDVAIAQSKSDFRAFRGIGKASPQQQLLEVTHGVPVPVLQVSLKAPRSFFQLGVPEIHIPGSQFVFVDLGFECIAK